jgi:prepilin-type N-terminal cleavage/methylation domain-containing protein
MMKLLTKNDGFTLIECMVTLVILTILLPMGGTLIEYLRTIKMSEHVSTASALCQQKLEELKKAGYEKIFTYTDREDTVGNYIRRWQIHPNYETQPGDPMDGMARVTVTVSYPFQGIRKDLEMFTYLSRAGG